MSEPSKKPNRTIESYSPAKPEILSMAEQIPQIKQIHEMTANSPIEIFHMPKMKLIGREIRSGGPIAKEKTNELWEMILENGDFDIIQNLPSVIPNSFMAWTGNYTEEDGTFSYIIGKFVPDSTPIPKGFTLRVLPETLVAKGIYGQGYSMVDIYKKWGYTDNYRLFGWNAELVFDDDPDEHDWSQFCEQKLWTNLSPVRQMEPEDKKREG